MKKIFFIIIFMTILCYSCLCASDCKEIFQKIGKGLSKYEKDVGTYPSTRQGLMALVKRPMTVSPDSWEGPYIKEIPDDPWNSEFLYAFPGRHDMDYDLSSKGPDLKTGTKDDIVNWSKKIEKRIRNTSSSPVYPELSISKNYTEKVGGLNTEMIWIGPGKFIFGSHYGSYGHPIVTLDGYWIGKYEITSEEFCIFLNMLEEPEKMEFIAITPGSTITSDASGKYMPRSGCEKKPAYPISWIGANAFCEALSIATEKKYMLPTEAQWERAARGGLKTKKYPWGDEDPEGRANFSRKEKINHKLITNVDKFPPNGYGLYDMAGNVMEWCRDWYNQDTSLKIFTNPPGPNSGTYKVLKGGNFISDKEYIKPRLRFHNQPWYKSGAFRMVREP
jgi:type II secretion system protein G